MGTGSGLLVAGTTSDAGYEIHHGQVTKHAPDLNPLITLPSGTGEGAVSRAGNVFGTHWHGLFESDQFRRAFLTRVAGIAGRSGFAVAPDTSFAAVRERTLDALGDLVADHLDTDALWRLIEGGAPPHLPFLPPDS